jgi:hypothetical protein
MSAALLVGTGGVLAEERLDPDKPLAEPGHPDHKHPSDASQSATDPSAILFQWGFFYWSSVEESAGAADGETLLFQPVIPLSKSNLLRPALPFLTKDVADLDGTEPKLDRIRGIGDVFLLDLFFFNDGHSTYGVGPVASLPTASDDMLGTGKFQLGASFVYLWKGFKKDLPGILLYNQWSVAGDSDRADVNVLNFQIVWVHHFNKSIYMGWTDQTGAVDWENGGRTSLPTGFRVGSVFKGKRTAVNVAAGVYYTFQEDRDNQFGIKFSASFIKPKWLQHNKKK